MPKKINFSCVNIRTKKSKANRKGNRNSSIKSYFELPRYRREEYLKEYTTSWCLIKYFTYSIWDLLVQLFPTRWARDTLLSLSLHFAQSLTSSTLPQLRKPTPFRQVATLSAPVAKVAVKNADRQTLKCLSICCKAKNWFFFYLRQTCSFFGRSEGVLQTAKREKT